MITIRKRYQNKMKTPFNSVETNIRILY